LSYSSLLRAFLTFLTLLQSFPASYAEDSEYKKFILAAEAAHKKKDYAKAIDFYSLALKEGEKVQYLPYLLSSLQGLSCEYELQGNFELAKSTHRRLIEIADSRRSVGNKVSSRQSLARFYQRQGKYAEAESVFKECVRLYEPEEGCRQSLAFSVDDLAKLHLAQRHYSEAELLFKRSLSIMESLVGGESALLEKNLLNLADLYKIEGKHELEQKFRKRALELKLRAEKRYAVAMKKSPEEMMNGLREQSLNNAITANPRNADAYASRAISYLGKKEYQKAIEDFSRALTLDPNSRPTYSLRALAYFSTHRYEKAIADYTRAIQLSSSPSEATPDYSWRAMMYECNGQHEEAIKDYTMALKLDQKWARNCYISRAKIYMKCGKFQNAIDDCTKAIGLKTGNSTSAGYPYWLRAEAYANTGKNQLAIEDRAKAKALGYKPKEK
jgi:tetratricopeptide (TPR) repeat protein